MNKAAFAQCKVVIRGSIVAAINGIWQARNQDRFQNTNIPWITTCSFIFSISFLAGNSAIGSSSLAIGDFGILKKYSFSINYPKHQMPIEVIWCPPFRG